MQLITKDSETLAFKRDPEKRTETPDYTRRDTITNMKTVTS
jgi:hypothetical protein